MTFINILLDILWSPATPAIIIAVAIYYSIRTKFVQLRKIKDMFRLLYQNRSKTTEGISGMQSFMISLAGRIGTGNVAGVAGAICYGGPGAVVWMCVAAVLGAATSFIESVLAQIYKTRFGKNEFRGGTAFYIEKGLGLHWLAVLFGGFAWFAQGIGFHFPNMSSIVSSASAAAGIPPIIPTVIVAALFMLIAIGGVKRIGTFSDKAVPFMGIVYTILCVLVLGLNITKIPATLALMFESAFNPNSFLGGMLGSAISWGVKRGLYSNEAGLGSATCAAAASNVKHPVQEGLTQSLAVYFDTLFICLIGAVTIIATDSYNIIDGAGNMIVANIPGTDSGVMYIQTAITSGLGAIGSYLLLICVSFFCFTSIMSFYYYGEVNINQIFKNHTKAATWFARTVSLLGIFLGGLTYSDFAWAIGDLALGMMAVINVPVVLFLGKYALTALKDYERQEKEGIKNPTFDPDALGIKGTEPGLWKELSRK